MSGTKLTASYSKWDNLEISDDDEKDCHPNIDINMWKRLKREKREQETEELEAERATLVDTDTSEARRRINEIDERIVQLDPQKLFTVTSERTCVNKEVTKEKGSAGSGSSSSSNSSSSDSGTDKVKKRRKKTEAEREAEYKAFVDKHSDDLVKFAKMKLEDSEEWLLANHGIMNQHGSGFLLLHMLELEMNGKSKAMENAARQYLSLQNILDLAEQIKSDPRATIKPFFKRIDEPAHKLRLKEELASFTAKVKARAVVKLKEMEEAARQEAAADESNRLSREERFGPGGLDPVEVLESLPKSMQVAFETRDMQALQDALKEMPIDEVRHHIKRCEDSGLWVPGGGDKPAEEDAAADEAAAAVKEVVVD